MTPLQRLAACRLAVVQKLPYLAQAILTMVPREMPGLATEAVTKDGVFLWDPIRWETIEISDGTFGVAHEAFHLVFDTYGRCAAMSADPRLFNVAADLAINPMLREGGFTPNPHDIFPAMFGLPPEAEMWSAEQIYRALEAKAVAAISKHMEALDGPSCGKGWCGSGGGRAVPNEPECSGSGKSSDESVQDARSGAGEGEGTGEVRGRSQGDLDSMRKAVAQSVRDNAQKGRGTMPGYLSRWCDEILQPPKVRWQDKLRRLARSSTAKTAGAVEHTFRKRSRRQQAGRGMPIVPGSHAPVPDVVFAIDTSGSMGEREIGLLINEVDGILRGAGCRELRIIACDAEVHCIAKVRSWRDVLPKLQGGGGTDFCPVFKAVDEMREKPSLLVFGTDGFGPAPALPPEGYDVIWILVGGTKAPVEWGESIDIDRKEFAA